MKALPLEDVREALRGTDFEGRAWLVGGAVRDRLLRRRLSKDVDIVVAGDAERAAGLLFEKGVASEPPVVYSRFGTAMVRVGKVTLEFATARKESYSSESRKPEVEPASIEDDAKRRDFTVNAILEDLFTGELLDPLGQGLHDLQHRVLRTPLDPAATFHDDPLRILRAIRFRWQLEFEPAPGLYEAIAAEAERINVVSAERVRDELVKMLRLTDAHECLADLMDLGIMAHIAPEFCEGVGMDQGPYHHLDVWSHTLEVVANSDPGDLTLRLAALFHDVAKPKCRKRQDGRITFIGHEVEGAEMTRHVMGRLRFPTDQIETVALLVKNHMRLLGIQELSESAARRLLRDLGDETERLIELCEADSAAHAPTAKRPDFDHVRSVILAVDEASPRESLDSPISGERIMAVTGLEQGEDVGRVKRHLAELVIEGKLSYSDVEGAEREARRFVGNRDNV